MFVGCDAPLLGELKTRSPYHGSDGFGDVPDQSAPDESQLQVEHGVLALLRLSKIHKGKYFTSLHLLSSIHRKSVYKFYKIFSVVAIFALHPSLFCFCFIALPCFNFLTFAYVSGDLHLVVTGPLTNVAMAIRLDHEFGTRLASCVIMGGNYLG